MFLGNKYNDILSLPFHCGNLSAKFLKFILKEPLGANFSNNPTLVLFFKSKKTSTKLVANVLYSTSHSICKSEKDGTSIASGNNT